MRRSVGALAPMRAWGAIEEDDNRSQLAGLRTQLAVAERLPDKQRILHAITVTQDIARAWQHATPDQRRRIV